MEAPTFQELIERSRRGDADAAEELVRRYEPALRREIRMYHTNPNLKRVRDTSDIVQSILGNFFVRLTAGQFEFEHPAQLVKLLATMAVNRIRDHARANKNVLPAQGSLSSFIGRAEPPSKIVANRELLQRVRDAMTVEERKIAERRMLGLKWDELADELGGSAEALRKQLARALDRIAHDLDLDSLDV